ncbi:hypothetical protein NX059_007674 [Plenodomus lindquistii]|nr:hypothetical protein NX059_007674 [Plenodomus lindquistii]
MAPFFTNDSCNPFMPKNAPCVVGAYVQYAVAAHDASDYKATIKFTQDHNIRLVIRNTGHDWLGKSSGAGAVALWTHHMKSVQVLDYESPHYTGRALKVGAGIQVMEAYKSAHGHGLIVVGGTCPSVGLAGGYTQGGGHGLTVSKYGLGADQALEWEVVTMDQKVLRASPTENQDLYWALAGGGAGTYAAVLSLTIKAYPNERTAAANLTFTNDGIAQDLFYAGMQRYLSGIPTILDAGATTTWLNSNSSFTMSPSVGVGMSKEELDQLHEPIIRGLDELGIIYTYYSADFPTYLDMFTQMNPFTESAVFQIGSRWIPRTVLANSTEKFTEVLRDIGETGSWISGVSFDVSRLPNVPNAINPAWRKASISLVVGTFYNYTSPAENIANQELMTSTIVPQLAGLIPGGGSAYSNEGDLHEPNWRKVFWGRNYARLRGIKQKYDPDGQLYARLAIGSDAWIEQEDGRLCRASYSTYAGEPSVR